MDTITINGLFSRPATYLEMIALEVWQETGEEARYPLDETGLWVGYAVLVLVKGKKTTSADVHEAWSAWAIQRYQGQHRSLVPFADLPPEVQALDDPYRDAIRRVAERH